jgi:hypothetical protein
MLCAPTVSDALSPAHDRGHAPVSVPPYGTRAAPAPKPGTILHGCTLSGLVMSAEPMNTGLPSRSRNGGGPACRPCGNGWPGPSGIRYPLGGGAFMVGKDGCGGPLGGPGGYGGGADMSWCVCAGKTAGVGKSRGGGCSTENCSWCLLSIEFL